MLASVTNTSAEIAVVGPDTMTRDDPHRPATIVTTMAVNSPYSGGRPAINANATPCGRTMAAPVKPAATSAFIVPNETSRCQARLSDNRLRMDVNTSDALQDLAARHYPVCVAFTTYMLS